MSECWLCGGIGYVDRGQLFGCCSPGTYEACPMCALTKQQGDLVVWLNETIRAYDRIAPPEDRFWQGHRKALLLVLNHVDPQETR